MDEATTQATFCATLVDEWASADITDAVIAPGSRSTPISVALARDPSIRVHVQVDERSAGFMALGLGLAWGRPAIVVTTSGTAAVELHPAVVEADLSGVPMLVVTTDRPPELHGVGAPQTVDQRGLYGRAVRSYVEPGVPREDAAWAWRSLASRAVLDAADGPVHLNLAFVEPLLAEPGPLPPARVPRVPWHQGGRRTSTWDRWGDDSGFARHRGVIVAGRGSDRSDVDHLAKVLHWPVLADPLSDCQHLDAAVTGFDPLLRDEAWAEAHRPDAVIRTGAPPASKVLSAWLRGVDPYVVLDHTGRYADPDRSATHVYGALTFERVDGSTDAAWVEEWRAADAALQARLDAALADDLTDPAIARRVVQSLDESHTLVVASSMPIRDVEWFGGPTEARVLANRGANGIDGVISTAVGVALTGVPTVALVGDLAFLHDTNALLGLADRGVDLTVVVVDNDGGAIFSFLPQAEQLDESEFERLFGTPHGLDLVAVAQAHGVEARAVTALDDLRFEPGVRVLVAKTDRQANVPVHQRLYDGQP